MNEGLSAIEKKVIKALMKSDGWSAIMHFVELKTNSWKNEPVTGQNAFEELRALHKRDGKVEGVLEVFEQLERQAFE